MKVSFITLGCRLNQYEGVEMQELLEEKDLKIVPFPEKADIYVINTCTVTSKSDYDCRQTIRRAIRSNKEAFIVVTGCYPQTNHGEIARLPGVDLILGNEEKLDIYDYLKRLGVIREDSRNRALKRGDPYIAVDRLLKGNKGVKSKEINRFQGHIKAFLKIQTGCNLNCSFCIVRLSRGHSRSEGIENIKRQVENLINRGFKEIVLSGINLGSYGRDLSPNAELSDLLKILLNINGRFRIRLSSIGPREVSDKLIDIIASSESICNHLHIPLQSGDDHILKKMRRDYDSRLYNNLIERLKKRIPDIGIGADVMVGFPGETDKMFDNTYRFVKDLPITYLHVFTFSPRKGTDAFNLPDRIPKGIGKERSSLMKRLGREKSLEFRRCYLNKELEVLIEESRDKDNGLLNGYSDNYIPIFLDGLDSLKNTLVKVKIMEIREEGIAIGEGL
ncbi:MAG: tRNA (N(6)-L-threonylcarbamoyladenosine(37)-C(2))-methylthiotransferase MtaB [Nitrospinae bacterium]|nr:tRNA (N(6)-L-threonylcarbamoyladenosine(37)-C(2))-methylthiotransferase MtaB [Nitrospinota bacterium]